MSVYAQISRIAYKNTTQENAKQPQQIAHGESKQRFSLETKRRRMILNVTLSPVRDEHFPSGVSRCF